MKSIPCFAITVLILSILAVSPGGSASSFAAMASGPAAPKEAPPQSGGRGEDDATPVSAGDQEVVLTVDGVTYSLEDLKMYVGLVLGKQPGEEGLADSLPRLALDIAGSKEALAEMPSLKDDPAVTDSVRKLRSRLLREAYLRKEIVRQVQLTPEALYSTLPDPPARYDVSVIVLLDEGKVQVVLDALSGGDSFEECARKYSDGYSSEKGGYIGILQDGKNDIFTEEEFGIIKAMKDGGVSKPFLSRIGWIIARLNRYMSPEEQKREDIRQNFGKYRKDRESKQFAENLERLSGSAKIEWNEDLVGNIKEKVNKREPIPDELTSSVVVTVNGVPLYAVDLGQVAILHSEQDLERYLARRVEEEVVAQEASRLGYGKEFERILDMQEKHAVTRRFFRNKGMSIRLTDEDVKKYLAENPEEFRRDEVRKIRIIETDNEKSAKKARKEIGKSVKNFPSVASRYNVNEEARKIGGDAGYLSRTQLLPAVADMVFQAREGEILGPMQMKGPQGEYYLIVLVEKIEKGRQVSLEELDTSGRQAIGNRIVSARMEKFHKDFLKLAAEKHGVEFGIIPQGGQGDDKGK